MKVHEASIYRKAVIIDWTERQFDSTLSIPRIIDLSLEKSLINRIEIHPSSWSPPDRVEREERLKKTLGTNAIHRYNDCL